MSYLVNRALQYDEVSNQYMPFQGEVYLYLGKKDHQSQVLAVQSVVYDRCGMNFGFFWG